MRPHASLLLLVASALHCLAAMPAAAGESHPQLRVKGCSKLTVRRVEEHGRIVYLSAGDTAFIFSAQPPLHMQLDPEPMGAASVGPWSSDDDNLRIEARPDGTVRWLGQDGGAERLAVCLDATSQPIQWVAFTTSGYYEGSPYAGRMVGWEVPGPEKTLDFFPLELLKQTFHHPSVVSRILMSDRPDTEIAATLYGRERLPPADIRRLLPPVMQVLEPAGEYFAQEKDLTVTVRVRSPSGLPMMILASSASGGPQKIYVPGDAGTTGNGRPAPLSAEAPAAAGAAGASGGPTARLGGNYGRKPAVAGHELSFPVKIPAADSIVQIRAQSFDGDHRPGPLTEPVNLKIRWRGDRAVRDKPNVYLLAIGVGDYRDKALKLEYPSKDADDFAKAFLAQQGKSYQKVVPVVLKDQAATRERILEELHKFELRELGENDLAVVFLAGHGEGNDETGRYRFLPFDAVLAAPERTMIDAAELQKILRNRRGGHLMFFIDTCHSGSVVAGAGTLTDLAGEIARDANVVVFTSSTGGQVSREWKRWGNGAFTKAVVEGLKGDADHDGTGLVTVSLLEYYVSQRVQELTQGLQTPTSVKPGSVPDFDIAKVYVPFWRRRWVRWTTGGLLVGALIAGGVVFGTQYHPDYQRGNTGWLVQF